MYIVTKPRKFISRSFVTSSSLAAASTPIRPPASLKSAFSIGLAAMNSLQRSMMRAMLSPLWFLAKNVTCAVV